MKKWKGAIQFGSLLLISYLGFFLAHKYNYYLKDGSTVINDAKRRALENGTFEPDQRRTVIFFVGNSRILSGFVPEVFDSLNQGRTQSFNLALGGTEVMDGLVMLSQASVQPDVIVLQYPWSEAYVPGEVSGEVLDMDDIVPFKDLFKDMLLFAGRARSQGYSLSDYYRISREINTNMLATRGYYFIEGQALYDDFRLPPDFTMAGDDTTLVERVEPPLSGANYAWIQAYCARHDIELVLGSEFRRYNERKPATPADYVNRAELAQQPRLHVTPGPPYYVMDNQYFSDAVHLNPTGARLWTARMHQDIAPLIDQLVAKTAQKKSQQTSQQGTLYGKAQAQ
ncbi:MAG: hypothetical protein OHK0039_41070 [Bacteroidia bacterium]